MTQFSSTRNNLYAKEVSKGQVKKVGTECM